VVDLYFGDMQPLRAGSKPILPVWLSPKEADRLGKLYTASISKGFSSVFGRSVAYGRPAPWPLMTRDQRSTANSCTTCFARAVVGERKPGFAWIDRLEAELARQPAASRIVGGDGLLASLDGKDGAQIARTFDALRAALPARRGRLDELQSWVEAYRRQLPAFPLELMHRQSVADLAGIAGDNPGPGKARQAYRGASTARIPLEIQFDRGH
jgi:hypothetical protein